MRALKREAQHDHESTRKWDERDNDETRLPESEAVHLGGLVISEAFTPSTVSALYKALERFPGIVGGRRDQLLEALSNSRRGSRSGWQNLGVVRRPGQFVMGSGFTDADLPEGVDAVWLRLNFETPSLAVLVATFTLTEEAGDLSKILRRDYQTRVNNVRMTVPGILGKIRARIPWARPARHRSSWTTSRAEDEKRRASDELIAGHQFDCQKWFYSRFPGRFAAAADRQRPVMRLVFTNEQIPFIGGAEWLRPVGLDAQPNVWVSTDPPGWGLVDGRWPYPQGRHVVTVAARRQQAASPRQTEGGTSIWSLTQRFSDEQSVLAARLAIRALLSAYADELSELRDTAGIKRTPRRAVAEARALDDYLLGDGLDATTITSSVAHLTEDLRIFRWNVPEYREDVTRLPERLQEREPDELVPTLCSSIRRQASRLSADTSTTTFNIRASAQLRQAIANTRLQRTILALSLGALIVALISLRVT